MTRRPGGWGPRQPAQIESRAGMGLASCWPSMARFATIFHCRGLTFAFIALPFGLAAFGRVFNFFGLAHEQGREFVQESLVLCIASFIVCIAVIANLVLDVSRGYSPNRCAFACGIMLLALSGPAILALTLAKYYSYSQ